MRAQLDRHFLASFCQSDDYPPLEGPYIKFTYGDPLSLADVRGFWKTTARIIRESPGFHPLGLYVHWPFCLSRCTFCFCDAYSPDGADEHRKYAALLRREIESLRDVLDGVPFTSIYLGGGTPTLSPAEVLDEHLALVGESFTIAPTAQIFVEGAPSTMNDAKLRVLLKRGVTRLSLGLQSLRPEVLSRINRIGQKPEKVERLVRDALGAGLTLNIDLMAGIEGQTSKSFLEDLLRVIGWGPQMLHLYHFDPRPHTPFASGGKVLSEARLQEIRVMLEAADRLLRREGYALARQAWNDPDLERVDDRQDTEWRRYNSSILGIGANALSHAFGAGWYQHPLNGSGKASREACQTYEGFAFDLEEEMRTYVIRNGDTTGRFSLSGFKALFGRDPMDVACLRGELDALVKEGKASIEGDACVFRLDPRERPLVFKRFYSPSVTGRILRTRSAERRAFVDEHRGSAPGALLSLLQDGERARFSSNRYFRAAPARGPAAAKEDACRS